MHKVEIMMDFQDARKRSPVKFEIAAATVDPQTPEYDPHPLIPYVESLGRLFLIESSRYCSGIVYHFLSYPLIELAKIHMQKNSICAFCSRMKRGILYSCMRKVTLLLFLSLHIICIILIILGMTYNCMIVCDCSMDIMYWCWVSISTIFANLLLCLHSTMEH